MTQPPSTIEDLQKAIIKFREERDWQQFHKPKDMAIGLMLEANEVLEHFHWKDGAELEQYLEEHRTELADELADVMYWVLLMAHDFGIDIVQAGFAKLEKTGKKYPIDKSRGNHKKHTQL